jgi:hypothetical protein
VILDNNWTLIFPDSFPLFAEYDLVKRDDGLGGTSATNWPPVSQILGAPPPTLMITEAWGGGTDTHFVDDSITVGANVMQAIDDSPTPDGGTSPDVADAVAHLGYRLRPTLVSYPSVSDAGEMSIAHTWTNDGVGVLPNNNSRWSKRYVVAFALFPRADGGISASPAEVFLDPTTNPGDFLNGRVVSYTTTARWHQPPGDYELAVGILDQTRPALPSLDLAIAGARAASFYLLGPLALSQGPAASPGDSGADADADADAALGATPDSGTFDASLAEAGSAASTPSPGGDASGTADGPRAGAGCDCSQAAHGAAAPPFASGCVALGAPLARLFRRRLRRAWNETLAP